MESIMAKKRKINLKDNVENVLDLNPVSFIQTRSIQYKPIDVKSALDLLKSTFFLKIFYNCKAIALEEFDVREIHQYTYELRAEPRFFFPIPASTLINSKLFDFVNAGKTTLCTQIYTPNSIDFELIFKWFHSYILFNDNPDNFFKLLFNPPLKINRTKYAANYNFRKINV